MSFRRNRRLEVIVQLLVMLGKVCCDPLFTVKAVRRESVTLHWLATKLSMPGCGDLFDLIGDFVRLSFN